MTGDQFEAVELISCPRVWLFLTIYFVSYSINFILLIKNTSIIALALQFQQNGPNEKIYQSELKSETTKIQFDKLPLKSR